MDEKREPSQLEIQKKEEPLPLICRYSELDSLTRSLIEGIPFNQLPPSISIDPIVSNLFSSFPGEIAQHRMRLKTATLKTALFERTKKILEASDDPEAQRHLDALKHRPESEQVSNREYSMQLYRVSDDVYKGKSHMGYETHVSGFSSKDNIDDRLTIIQIHNHTYPSPLSRGDLGTMLVNDNASPTHWLNLVAAPKLNLVGILCEDSKKQNTSQLDHELKLSDTEAYIREVSAVVEDLPGISDERQIQFIHQFADILNLSQRYQVGIYYSLASENSTRFTKATTLDQIIELSKNLFD